MNLRIISLVTVLALPLIIPMYTQAEYQNLPENEFFKIATPAPLTTADITALSKEEKLEYLMQLVSRLQEQLAALLERKGLSIEGQTKRFDIPVEMFVAPGIKVVGGGGSAGAFIGDGNDLDDDSLQFQLTLDITNTNLSQSLIIDRESIKIMPVDSAGRVVEPKHVFGVQTGIQITAEYGFDKNERHVIVIAPGQTSKILLHHIFQFSKPGTYRGKLDSLKFTHDTVAYNAKENQFTQNSQPFTLNERSLQTIPIKFQTLLINSLFKDVSSVDNQINLTQFSDETTGVSFNYPSEFVVERAGEEIYLTYNGKPQIIFSTEGEPKFKTTKLLSEKVTMYQADRVREKIQTFVNQDASGVALTIVPMNGDYYALTVFDYAASTHNFTPYRFKEIMFVTYQRE